MSDNGPEEFGAEAGSEDAGSDAAEKAREILERIKGDSDEMAADAGAMVEPTGTGDDIAASPIGDRVDDDAVLEDNGMLETAGAAITGAVGGAAAAAEGLFDRAKDALDDIMDDDAEMLPPESGVEHVVGTSGGDDPAQTSWIGWMLGAAGIVLLLALLVSQCADASTRSSIESAGAAAVGHLGVAALMTRNLFRS